MWRGSQYFLIAQDYNNSVLQNPQLTEKMIMEEIGCLNLFNKSHKKCSTRNIIIGKSCNNSTMPIDNILSYGIISFPYDMNESGIIGSFRFVLLLD